MECPHLAGELMKYCAAEKAVYVPSISELREFCNHRQHRICQFYTKPENSTASMSVTGAENRGGVDVTSNIGKMRIR